MAFTIVQKLDKDPKELLSDCAQSINNIPIDTKNHGYTLLSVEQDGTKLRYLIQR